MAEVTVIIPTYNRSKLVAQAVESVLKQSFVDFELIVIDDGSNDDTADVIKAIPDKRIKYLHQKKRGISSARNIGIKHSTSKYISFLDSDDLYPPEYLKVMLEALKEKPGYGLAYSLYQNTYPDGTSQKGFQQDRYLSGHLTANYFRKAPAILPSVVLVKKSEIKKQLYFDENIDIAEDLDFFLRVSTETKFVCVPQAVVTRRFLGDNVSFQAEPLYINVILIYERFYPVFKDKVNIPKFKAHKMLGRLCRKGARWNLKRNNRKAAIKLITRALRYSPFCLRHYKILVKALLKSKKSDQKPGWQLESLPVNVLINGTSREIVI